MATDYDKIRENNIREYGEGTRHLSFLGRLYTDRTHFVFELLQNAEDAGATSILFSLFADRLEVTHDGRPFNELDVKGVCGVGEGTKSEDLTQIGKFGIGFKSVYAYTSTPEVHSGGEGFRIENYVRPYAAHPKPVGNSWTTLFVFPFNSSEIVAETACKEIGIRLRTLSARALLFLKRIIEIDYTLPDSTGGFYLREEIPRGPARQVRVIGHNNRKDEEERWVIFESPVPVPGKSDSVRVEVGFRLEAEDKDKKIREHIRKVNDSPLFVYFPTEKPTRLGFLIQGPYRTTPSRDNIPKDDDWNETLVRITAELVVNILPEIKKLGLLSVSFLEALPIRTEDFPDDSMFCPIVASVRNTLMNEELLPADDGSFVSASNAKLARGAELRKLLGQSELRQLFQSSSEIKWLSADITQDRAIDLHHYLIRELRVDEVSPDGFARRITIDFLAGQPDEWYADFYGYLAGQEALWRAPRWDNDTAGMLRSKPILRLENGRQVAPYNQGGTTPNAYLPPSEETDLPVVKRSIANDERSFTFLTRLGLSEPNVFDDIVERVLPKYTDGVGELVPDADHEDDIRKIVRAMGSDSDDGKKKFMQRAMQTPFLKATNASGHMRFKKPDEIYFNTTKLRQYFFNSKSVWFLNDDYLKAGVDTDTWRCLGVLSQPRKLQTSEGPPSNETQYSTREVVIENFDLDGLKQFLKGIPQISDPAEQRSSAFMLWSILRNHLDRDSIFFKAKYRWFYYSWHSKFFDSLALVRLKGARWIPTREGCLAKPSEITTAQLMDEFLGARELTESLGIVEGANQSGEEKRKRELAAELGFSLEDIEFIENNRAEFELFKAVSFARKEPPSFPIKSVANPEHRQERFSDQLSDAPDKSYEKRERSVRATSGAIDPITWLRNQYTNEFDQMVCQICKYEMPFRKRDGNYYFEKKEVLSRSFLTKENIAQYLALCPLCAAKYEEFIKSDDVVMAKLKEAIITSNSCEVQLLLVDQLTSIRFVEAHYHDLKIILGGVS